MENVITRAVRPEDEPFLLDLYADSRKDERKVTNWTDSEWEEFILFQYSAQYRDYMERFPDSQYDVVYYGDMPVGRIWIGRIEDEIRLMDITIHSFHQNKGIGTYLIRQLQDEARKAQKSLRHMVATENYPAIRLYERLGFKFVYTAHLHNMMEWNPA